MELALVTYLILTATVYISSGRILVTKTYFSTAYFTWLLFVCGSLFMFSISSPSDSITDNSPMIYIVNTDLTWKFLSHTLYEIRSYSITTFPFITDIETDKTEAVMPKFGKLPHIREWEEKPLFFFSAVFGTLDEKNCRHFIVLSSP